MTSTITLPIRMPRAEANTLMTACRDDHDVVVVFYPLASDTSRRAASIMARRYAREDRGSLVFRSVDELDTPHGVALVYRYTIAESRAILARRRLAAQLADSAR